SCRGGRRRGGAGGWPGVPTEHGNPGHGNPSPGPSRDLRGNPPPRPPRDRATGPAPDPAPAASRMRLDRYLVDAGLAASRQQAQAAIMAGHVYVDGRRVDKPGYPVAPGAQVEVRGPALPFVSRGGLKLAHALDHFG